MGKLIFLLFCFTLILLFSQKVPNRKGSNEHTRSRLLVYARIRMLFLSVFYIGAGILLYIDPLHALSDIQRTVALAFGLFASGILILLSIMVGKRPRIAAFSAIGLFLIGPLSGAIWGGTEWLKQLTSNGWFPLAALGMMFITLLKGATAAIESKKI